MALLTRKFKRFLRRRGPPPKGKSLFKRNQLKGKEKKEKKEKVVKEKPAKPAKAAAPKKATSTKAAAAKPKAAPAKKAEAKKAPAKKAAAPAKKATTTSRRDSAKKVCLPRVAGSVISVEKLMLCCRLLLAQLLQARQRRLLRKHPQRRLPPSQAHGLPRCAPFSILFRLER